MVIFLRRIIIGTEKRTRTYEMLAKTQETNRPIPLKPAKTKKLMVEEFEAMDFY